MPPSAPISSVTPMIAPGAPQNFLYCSLGNKAWHLQDQRDIFDSFLHFNGFTNHTTVAIWSESSQALQVISWNHQTIKPGDAFSSRWPLHGSHSHFLMQPSPVPSCPHLSFTQGTKQMQPLPSASLIFLLPLRDAESREIPVNLGFWNEFLSLNRFVGLLFFLVLVFFFFFKVHPCLDGEYDSA